MSIILIGTKNLEKENSIPIGVSEIREIIRSLHLSPPKTVVIKNAERLTEEAQNALLKTLEEPPEGAQIILETSDEDLLLETIRSRCEITYSLAAKPKGDADLIEKIDTLNLSEKLDLAKKNSIKRDESLNFLDTMLLSSQNRLIPRHIRSLFKAKRMLRANCNVRLVMENLFLNW